MSDERGQAVIVAVLGLAIAAAAVIGLREAQGRIVSATRSQRAGEAAVEAAAEAVADVYVAHRLAARDLVADPRVLEAARAAAEDLAEANGTGGVERLELLCDRSRIETRLVLNGFSHHAGFSAPECLRS